MKAIGKGERVYWRDPAGEASGIYEVLSGCENGNEDSVIPIGNGFSKAEVHAAEVNPLSSKVVFRKWKKSVAVMALFPEQRLADDGPLIVASYDLTDKTGEADYHHVMDSTVPAGMEDCLSLIPELKKRGYGELETVTGLMKGKELIRIMGIIASNLISTAYITDFTIHDVEFIRQTKAKVPFIWLVKESGTSICQMDFTCSIKNLIVRMDHYDSSSAESYCLFRCNGSGLYPVFPKVIRRWAESELKKTGAT
ncbi:hypothetical protein FACS189415_7340 [Bacteroidia bacterium]|nr:hypothetical protein FACS189415_7340 [Bacteroidia bacterium]